MSPDVSSEKKTQENSSLRVWSFSIMSQTVIRFVCNQISISVNINIS